MPAVSKKQQHLMALAEHNPRKVYKRNRGVLKMSHSQLHDFASTTTKKLPQKVSKTSKVRNHVKEALGMLKRGMEGKRK